MTGFQSAVPEKNADVQRDSEGLEEISAHASKVNLKMFFLKMLAPICDLLEFIRESRW